MELEGHTEFALQGRPGLDPPGRRSADLDLDFPWTGVLGVSYRPTRKWNLEFNVDYTDWSSLGTTAIRQSGASPPWPVQQNIPVKLGWQSSWMYSVGMTRYFEGGWRVSAGYVFSQNSVPDRYYTPLAADLDRHFFAIGFGHKGKTFDFDMTYQFGYGPDHSVSGSTP